MMESQKQIDLCLKHAGEDLTFTQGVIKGIPGSLVYNIQNFDSPYDIDKQDFDFQVSNLRLSELGILPGDSFTYTLVAKVYYFKIKSFIDDLTGWLQLVVTLVEVT